MNGKLFVTGFLALAVAGAGGAVLFRQRSRAPLAMQLEDRASRRVAFEQILRANNAWGLANEYTYDESGSRPGVPYLRTLETGGHRWHVVRAAREEQGDIIVSATFIFTEDGKLAHFVEGAVPITLNSSEMHAQAALIVLGEAEPAPVHSVFLVGEDLREALRVRGDFKVESAAGFVYPSTAKEVGSLPVFRYDFASTCFHGPPGGSDTPWEVDRDHSPGYCP